MGVVSDHQKIGVVGIYNSGKTVFLTSLINHLLHHNPDEFRIQQNDIWRKADKLPIIRKFIGDLASKPIQLRKARTLDLHNGETAFEYERYRSELITNNVWPYKTEKPAHYRLKFKVSNRPWLDAKLHFFDFPGERIADAAIGLLNYEQWSDHMLRRIKNDADYRSIACDFLGLLDGRGLDCDELTYAYKLTLAGFRKNYRPMISPSSFILDFDGKLINSNLSTEEMIAGRYVGCNAEDQFVPLSESARLANAELSEKFKLAYKRYKKEYALPILRDLRSCDRLIILVDIPTILNSGHLMANDVHEITRDLLDFCNPGKNMFEKLYALSGLPFLLRRSPLEDLAHTKITRIAFAASKCDLVHNADRDNLILLLKELIDRLPEEYDGVKTDFFACSAVQSTLSDPNEQGLIGVPDDMDSASEKEMLVKVSRVPKHFPDRWEAGEFCFPDFKPSKFPGLKTRPPKQLGVDRILSFILGSNWTD